MSDGSKMKSLSEISAEAAASAKMARAFLTVKNSSAALQRSNELLLAALELTETKAVMLSNHLAHSTKECATLKETVSDLEYKNKGLLIELRKAMKIRGKETKDSSTVSSNDEKPSESTEASLEEKKGDKKRGAPIGHKGASRPVPKHVDAEITIDDPGVCHCGCMDTAPIDEFDVKYVEDIPPVSKHVTKLIYRRGVCTSCGKKVRHEDAIKGPPTKIGPVLSAYLTLLKQNGSSYGQLSTISTDMFGVPLSRSGALGVVSRVTEILRDVYEIIGSHVKLEDIVYADETTWKVRGVRWYVWVFCNHDMAYFHAVKSRASAVVEDVLGKKFKGIVVCDFYAAYNVINKTQRCLVHLLGDVKKEREILTDSKLLAKFDQRIKDFINSGLEVRRLPDGKEKKKKIKTLKLTLKAIAKMPVTKGKAKTLQKRITKYHDDICRFIDNPDLDWHNNRSERQVRPIVIERKMSFGSDTPEGAHRTVIQHSVIETCKLQKIDPLQLVGHAVNSTFTYLENVFNDVSLPIKMSPLI